MGDLISADQSQSYEELCPVTKLLGPALKVREIDATGAYVEDLPVIADH